MRQLRPLLLGATFAVVLASCSPAAEQLPTATTAASSVAATSSPTSATTSSTTTAAPPPTTTVVERGTVEPAPTVASRRADLDGDGDREEVRLMRRPDEKLLIDDVEVRLPFDVPAWSQLFVVDLDRDDGLKEAALLRRFDRGYRGEESATYDLLIVAFVDGEAHVDRPVHLHDMVDMITNGAKLDGEIKSASSNCLTTTSIHHVYGPLAEVISRQITLAPSERDDPACGNPDIWITREADLDGDGIPEEIMLQGRRLFIGDAVQEVPFPGQRGFSDDWSFLAIIDLDSTDNRREVAVLREAEEELAEALVVAYEDGHVYSSGVLDIWSGGQDFSDGAVMHNRILTSVTNCALATEVEYTFGPLAQVLLERRTTTGTFDPDMCFG